MEPAQEGGVYENICDVMERWMGVVYIVRIGGIYMPSQVVVGHVMKMLAQGSCDVFAELMPCDKVAVRFEREGWPNSGWRMNGSRIEQVYNLQLE
jgi:hypothetical protein